VRVIEVTAPAQIRAARLAARAREDAADVRARLARTVALPDDVTVETVVNDGSLEEGVARFLAALRRLIADRAIALC
jgi:ribose 1,5-bisphosphokinase PhnN